MTIARNLVLNEYRRRSRKSTESLDAPADSSSAGGAREIPDTNANTPSQALARQELGEIINAAILALPEQQRAAIILSRYQEMSYEEISKVLKVSIPATKSLLFRARDTLKERLKPYLKDHQ
jgi:RNA polymerase sigma-70 factor (ECF subfamily)